MTHEDKVQRVAAQVRDFHSSGNPVLFRKKSVSHFVPNAKADTESRPEIDLSDLDEILEIDTERGICVAESAVTFRELVRRTLPLGLIPTTVPELDGITIGGAVSGCSIEGMSYRRGGFHDSCEAYEVITGTGEILNCSRSENQEAFEALHGSYGRLGILTKLTFRLLPGKPYVKMSYPKFKRFEEFWAFLRERCEAADHDFIDAIVHSPDCFVVCLGDMVDEAPQTSDYSWLHVFYKSTRELDEDYLRTEDYFFRYDTECHWLSRTVPFMETVPARLVLGKLLLGSTNLISWSNRLAPIFRLQKRPDVVVDVFIPSRRFEEFYRWYERDFDFFPLWIVPYRMPEFYPWVADEHRERAGEKFFIDCAVYGKRNNHPTIDYSELIERKVYELGGIKTLISHNHYDPETFWSIYSRPRYEAAKQRLDPANLFGDLYEMTHPARR